MTQPQTMNTLFYRDPHGLMVAAPSGDIAMYMGVPVINWSFKIQQVEELATTLEELLAVAHTPEVFPHRDSLQSLLLELRGMLVLHQKQHEQVVTEAPTAQDLLEYISSYAAANISATC